MAHSIDETLAILVALEMINDLALEIRTTREDIEDVRKYIYSIESVLPIEIITELYELVSHIEKYKHKLERRYL